jgi:E3 ubiquitin-protein ligase TRIP12
MSDDSAGDALRERYEEDDDDDPFEHGFLSRAGLHGSIRALSGMLSGTTSRLRGILEKLKQKDDPSIQLIALQDFSELLLVSTEDNLAGHFSPDQYVKELVSLMQGDEFGGSNPEMMLLACRCLANMMEALPSSTANVVYGGSVPVLCQKLLEIDYIDLAEQAISTLEKISVEFPAAIVREGGLTAILTYLDFFPTGTQRTAVTAAANCCRNIPDDSFPVVRDVMPILLGVLNSSDQKVLEQGCLCVSRIVQSFRYHDSKLEELVSEDLLRAILRLLLPGTTNLISSNIHTQFLSVLANVARASPRRSVELLKMNVVDTLYQILTGVSPPSGTDDIVAKIDKVIIMQALIHRPRDQIFETLNVICEILPNVQSEGLLFLDQLFDAGFVGHEYLSMNTLAKKSSNDKRLKQFKACKDELKRFTIILLPTLTDAYSSTVNLSVRQKVLTAQLKMLSNVDVDILEEALRNVSYSSFLAAILTQQDHPTLVTFALQAAELLLKRLENIYRYQFYREGVISEIAKLAARPVKTDTETPKEIKSVPMDLSRTESNSSADGVDVDVEMDIDHEQVEAHDDEDNSDEDPEDEDRAAPPQSSSSSESSSDRPNPGSERPPIPSPEDTITLRAKKFIDTHEDDSKKQMRFKADAIREDLKRLTEEIKTHFGQNTPQDGLDLFKRLAEYFDQDALESVTSYELLSSNLVETLLDVFAESNSRAAEARSSFLEAFMGQGTQTKEKTANSTSPATPFSAFVHKLQDLLSRAEHFEVITVNQNNFDSNSRGSAAGMLAKQLKIKLKAEDDSGIPESFRQIMVSIHAIATFKALDDYLRPRIALAENPRRMRDREMLPGAIAAYAAALAGRRTLDGRNPLLPPPMPAPTDTTNRPHPKRGSRKNAIAGPPAPAQSDANADPPPPSMRRSSRRQNALPPPPPAAVEEPQIEVNDETQLSDDMDEDDLDDEELLKAMVGHLHEESSEDEEAPPVTMEVADTGAITARQGDGTRVATPVGTQQPPTGAGPSAGRLVARRGGDGTPVHERPSSYAAALQAKPTDWHLEFTVNSQPVSIDTTIYRAVHFNQNRPAEVSTRNVWHDIHTIGFKKVTGPPPVETASFTPPPESVSSGEGLPASIARSPTTAAILRLLGLLHGLNANIDDVLALNKETIQLVSEPSSQFVNTKLTAKLNRQLEEPLVVASNCLPTWSEDLARLYPFLFPFETRHLFLQSTSFGYSRSMSRWQTNQTANDSRHDRHRDDRPFLGKTQRQKVRISRQKMLESAMKVMDIYGSSPSILEVEYFEEVGTGLGPTLEFYSTVSKEFAKKKLKLWRENESPDASEYAFGSRGLFPAPMSEEFAKSDNGKRIVNMFTSLGKFVARSMLDSRIIDLNFNSTFFRIGDTKGSVAPSLGAVRSVDKDLANSLKLLKKFAEAKKKIDENGRMTPADKVQAIQDIEIDGAHVEDLALDFTLPGYSSIELIADGANVSVTIDNVAAYVEKVLDFTLGVGVRPQVDAFRAGFSQVFPYTALQAFTPDELVMLFGRVDEDWTIESGFHMFLTFNDHS